LASRHLLLDTAAQVPASTTPCPTVPQNLNSRSDRWNAYINGGAAADDVKVLQRGRDEQAQYLETIRNVPTTIVLSSKATKLIEVSPKNKAVSKNANLLVDLNFDVEPESNYRQQSYANAASITSKDKTKMNTNLLD
jgi:helicase required for RNAi-mediated heterochromatin assembly 1